MMEVSSNQCHGMDQSVSRAKKLPPLCPPFRFATVDVSTHVQVLIHTTTSSGIDTTDAAHEDQHQHQSPSNANVPGNNGDSTGITIKRSETVKVERRRKSDGDDGDKDNVQAICPDARVQHSELADKVTDAAAATAVAAGIDKAVDSSDTTERQQRQQQILNDTAPNETTRESNNNKVESNSNNNNNNNRSDVNANDYDEEEEEEEEEEDDHPMDNTIKYDSYLRAQRMARHATISSTTDTNTNIESARAAASRSSPLSVHRGAYPTLHNFRFLRRLNLKSLVSLLPKPTPTTDLVDFCASEGIDHHCFPTTRNSDVVLVSSAVAAKVVELLLEPANLPCYVHCVDGRHATGLVMMALRAVQQWSPISIITEYSRFVKDAKLTEEETMFVAVFSSPIHLPPVVPAWLWRGALPAKIHDKVNGDVGTAATASTAIGLDLVFPTASSCNNSSNR